MSVRPVRGHDGTSVILTLDASLDYERLRDELVRVLGQSPQRWRNGNARLDLGDRSLDLFDVRRMVHLLRDEFGLSVTALYTSERALHRYVARELKLQIFIRDPAEDWTHDDLERVGSESDPDVSPDDTAPTAVNAVTELAQIPVDSDGATVVMAEPGTEPDGEASDEAIIEEDPDVRLPLKSPPLSFAGGRRALTLGHTLRGGQRIQFPGDIIVFGDINPGAAVEAGGHILVMGSLRGMVHAGMYGDVASVILAFDLRPTQLRIGTHIAFPEDPGSTDHSTRGRGTVQPQLACVKGDGIFIQAYTGRLPVVLAPSSPPHDAASTTGSAATEPAHTE